MFGNSFWFGVQTTGHCTRLCALFLLSCNEDKEQHTIPSFPCGTPNSTFRLSTIDETFVCDQLMKIKTSKSTGLTNIPARLLKDGCNALAKPLTILMNRSLAEGSIPFEWKHAMVTPVHKSGLKTDAANYRPISVLPVFV